MKLTFAHVKDPLFCCGHRRDELATPELAKCPPKAQPTQSPTSDVRP